MSRLVKLAVATLFAIAGLVGIPATARADTATDYYACVDAGNVWVVVNYRGSYRMGCAKSPSNGTDALRQVISIEKSSNGMISRIGGNPATINADPYIYWNYFHRSSGGAAWEYSQLGADSYKPRPGSTEGWAYGATGVGVNWSAPARPAATTAPPRTTAAAPNTQTTQGGAAATGGTNAGTGRTTQVAASAGPTTAAATNQPTTAAPSDATASTEATPSIETTPTASAATPSPSPEASATTTPLESAADPMRSVDRGSPVATIATLAVVGVAAAGGGGWWLVHRRRSTS